MRSQVNDSASCHVVDFEESSISEDSRALAARLSNHMGIEQAMHVSTENQWHGVVAALREIQKRKSRIC